MSFRVREVGFDGVFVLVTTLTSLLGLVTRSSSSSSSCRGSTAVLYTHVIIFTRRFLLKSSNTRSAHTSVTSPSSPHLWPPLRVLARKADFCRCLTANHVDPAKKGTQTSPKSLSLGPPVGFFSRYILICYGFRYYNVYDDVVGARRQTITSREASTWIVTWSTTLRVGLLEWISWVD